MYQMLQNIQSISDAAIIERICHSEIHSEEGVKIFHWNLVFITYCVQDRFNVNCYFNI